MIWTAAGGYGERAPTQSITKEKKKWSNKLQSKQHLYPIHQSVLKGLIRRERVRGRGEREIERKCVCVRERRAICVAMAWQCLL